MTQASPPTDSIPILTDLIQDTIHLEADFEINPSVDVKAEIEANPVFDVPVLTDIVLEEIAVPLPVLTEAITPTNTEQLQVELQEKILRALQGRISTLIDDRFQQVMHGLLTQFVLTFAEDLKVSVQEHLADIVKRAVAQELAKSVSEKNKLQQK